MDPRIAAVRARIDAWCAGHWWPPRALLLVLLAWNATRHLVDGSCSMGLFGGINMGIHEGGHVLFGPLGSWLCTAGGTITQCAAPVVAAGLLLRQGDWFGVPVCAVWLGDNLYGVALYCGDASAMALTLVNIGGVPGDPERMHDWHVLLDSVGMLGAEAWLAPLIRSAAFLLTWTALGAGAWLCWRMSRAKAGRG